jgi:hypothetical protein
MAIADILGAAGGLGGASSVTGAIPSSSATSSQGAFQAGDAANAAANNFGSGVRGFVNNYAAKGSVNASADTGKPDAGFLVGGLQPIHLALVGGFLFLILFRKRF